MTFSRGMDLEVSVKDTIGDPCTIHLVWIGETGVNFHYGWSDIASVSIAFYVWGM